MKFDVTIANPPYKHKITQEFINKTLETSRIACFLVPNNVESKDNYNIKNNDRLKYIIKNNDIFHNVASIYTQILLYQKDKVEQGETYLIDNRDDKRLKGRGRWEQYLIQTPEATEHWNKILETLDKNETSEELKIYKISLYDGCNKYSIDNLLRQKVQVQNNEPFINTYEKSIKEQIENTKKEINLQISFAEGLAGLYNNNRFIELEKQMRLTILEYALFTMKQQELERINTYIENLINSNN